MITNLWEFWIDRGGTFTDIVAKRPDGALATLKLLSENPEQYPDAALAGIRRFMDLSPSAPIPSGRIGAVKMGTTVATNALLERHGDRTVLAISVGFRDALRIGYQSRPRLFDRHIVLPELLYERVVEVPGRMSAAGDELVAVDLESVAEGLQEAFDAGIRACAVVLMHGYRYPEHEQAVAGLARQIGFTQVSVSSEVSPLQKLVSRGDTTTVDAYLSPVLRRYVDRVAAELGGTRLAFMQSNGGLTNADAFRGKDSILSGPAGGIIGARHTSDVSGFGPIVTFDMGGTSTDVAVSRGELEREFETTVAGVRVCAPMMSIHTVAAGGGSICALASGRYRVGPASAGANPGPASYRRGGPLTVTDCNVLLGRVRPELFPHVFGPSADQPLDTEAVRRGFAELSAAIERETGDRRSPEQVAQGFLRIAVENMANAIKKVSVQRGHNVKEYTLCSFGGAGGQHACLVADALGMEEVFIHGHSGVLSAYGMGLADMRLFRSRPVDGPLDSALAEILAQGFGELEDEGRDAMVRQGVPVERILIHRRLHLRYAGSDVTLLLDFGTNAELEAAFREAHQRRYGFTMERELVVASMDVEVVGSADCMEEPAALGAGAELAQPLAHVPMHSGPSRCDAPVYERHALPAGQTIDGPAILKEDNGTTIVEQGWRASVNPLGHLVLRRSEPLPETEAVGTDADPVMLEVFNNLFMSIAEEMGVTLAHTAHSVNIKERLDFSCALFDGDGSLIANAPHVPVHLGSMGQSVETLIARNPQMVPGDVFALNDPYNGGTHLPDITVVTPVFDGAGEQVRFYVASRGHHADVGGISPGSMPPASTTVHEEGALIDNFKLVDKGRFREQEFVELLQTGPWPARNPSQNLADIRAQIAANEAGARGLNKMVHQFGAGVVQAYMGHVQDNAEECVRRVLAVLSDGEFTLPMDDGSQVQVAVSVDQQSRRATIDFSGTSAQRSDNFNAPMAVCTAAVLYVFRTLVDEDIPLNAGCLKPLSLVVPEGCMLNPKFPAAVVAGNVETSQAVTDALFGALGVLAASQGTMNNFTFGNDQYQYYETICGGSGAGNGFDGTDAVQTHMTNSRLTDPEVLEWRYPVTLESFAIRPGSGGAGQYRGGAGATRRIRFNEAMTAAILSGRRRVAPFGLSGGGPGGVGRSWVERASGAREELAGTAEVAMDVGDVFVIETPGGGGFGRV